MEGAQRCSKVPVCARSLSPSAAAVRVAQLQYFLDSIKARIGSSGHMSVRPCAQARVCHPRLRGTSGFCAPANQLHAPSEPCPLPGAHPDAGRLRSPSYSLPFSAAACASACLVCSKQPCTHPNVRDCVASVALPLAGAASSTQLTRMPIACLTTGGASTKMGVPTRKEWAGLMCARH